MLFRSTVELSYVGRSHSDNSLVMRFPAEGVLFAVDFIPVKSMAFRDLPDSYIGEWIDSLKAVEAMQFSVLAPGHGPLGTPADVSAFREYFEGLRDQVLALVRQGKSLDEVKQAVDLRKYESWAGYKDMGPLNVEGMYKYMQTNRRPN